MILEKANFLRRVTKIINTEKSDFNKINFCYLKIPLIENICNTHIQTNDLYLKNIKNSYK